MYSLPSRADFNWTHCRCHARRPIRWPHDKRFNRSSVHGWVDIQLAKLWRRQESFTRYQSNWYIFRWLYLFIELLTFHGKTRLFIKVLLSVDIVLFVYLGGLVMLSQKHKDARKVKYQSGFYITTNKRPKFGTNTNNPNSDSSSSSSSSSSEDENDDNVRRNKDHDAVYNRLRCFKTKPLPVKDSSVASK